MDNAVAPSGGHENLEKITLAELRRLTKKTQKELAEILGKTQGTIATFEKRSLDQALHRTLRVHVEAGLGAKYMIVVEYGERRYLLVVAAAFANKSAWHRSSAAAYLLAPANSCAVLRESSACLVVSK